ncbi:glycosyltransferase family 4 protein [Paucisalibacillus globulus]|uniref:glycosyltransferase family 4 protein n=1 Tax=Paucisalibacillus globulus TaxID=351095 RepID=UPI0006841634|nr:glycosyltransferase family 4 protein [Paucisalibacillus globulus]
MKCLIVTTLDRQIILFLVPHIKLLQEMGYTVTIATFIINEKELAEQLPHVHLIHLPFSRSIRSKDNIRAFFKIRKLIRKEKYPLIHVHTPIASFLTRLASTKKQSIVYTAHGFHFNENGAKISNQIYYAAEKYAARKTDKLIVMNTHDYEKAKEFLPASNIHFIHGIGIDATFYNPNLVSYESRKSIRESLHLPLDKTVITHIAEFNENKRQIDILEAVEKMKEVHQDFVVLLVGDGKLVDEIKIEVQNKGLHEYVRCLGFREDIRELLSITDIGLLVSEREGLPKSVMEMMAMEKPVVVSNIRGNRDLVEEASNGLLVPVKDSSELMRAILLLVENREFRNRLGTTGRKLILEKYDLPLILEKTKEVYLSINQMDNVEVVKENIMNVKQI